MLINNDDIIRLFENMKFILNPIKRRPEEIREIMNKNNIIIDDLEDIMQKFAFTLYSDIAMYSEQANELLEIIKNIEELQDDK